MKRNEIKPGKLSDTTVVALEPESVEYRIRDGQSSLYLVVHPAGRKRWELRYKKPSGKWSWLGIGPYGKAAHQLTGAQARQKSNELIAATSHGDTPLDTKRKAVQQEQDTLKSVALEWHAAKREKWSADTAQRVLDRLALHVFPKFGSRPFTRISAQEWMRHFEGMSNTPEQMRRVRADVSGIYDFGLVLGRCQNNPASALRRFLPAARGKNYPHVQQEEMPGLIRTIRSEGYARPDVRLGLQLLSILHCRPSELREARWSEFDLENCLWTIPAERTKTRREHIAALPRQAVALLHELRRFTGAYSMLFPGHGDSKKPLSNMTWNQALKRLGYHGKQSGHGFRHLFSTAAHEHGWPSDHVEASLAHAKRGVRAVYDKATHLRERRQIEQWWADHLDALAKQGAI